MLTGICDSFIIRHDMEEKKQNDELTNQPNTETVETPEKKKGLLASMSSSGRELMAEVGILFLAGVMFVVPIVLWAINNGFFGEIYLSGRGGFSPFMDRLLILSVMFFVLYAVSWIKSEIPYRAVKVFGVMALLALVSIVAIQLDTTLVSANAEFAPLMNKWFFTAPIYALSSTVAVITSKNLYFGWQFMVTLIAFLLASGVLLWDIKVELAGNWKTAVVMWLSFEVLYLIAFWLVIQFIGWPMFPPVSI